jgi:hypothetical protein
LERLPGDALSAVNFRPLTMAAAGLVIGNYGKKTAIMSAVDKDYLDKFGNDR